MTPKRYERTALSKAVDVLYAQCLTTGGHIDSGRTVRRTLHGVDLNMIECFHCGVPYTTRSVPRAAISINNRYRRKENND